MVNDVQNIRDQLKQGLHTITFIKATGETRVLVATLETNLLPVIPPMVEGQVAKPTRVTNPLNISVYVPSLLAWRSFNINNLISVVPVK